MPFFTALGDVGLVWIVLIVTLLLIPLKRWHGLKVLLAFLFSAFIGNILLKPIVARLRPFELNTVISLIIDKPSGYSFPSGHTITAFAAATAMFIGDKRFGSLALVLAFLISFSRLYLYVHFPSDVIAGAVLGIVSGVIACIVVDIFNKKGNKGL